MKTKKNAGFSLVELIVVIAIMAVLVGVLAPAYLKYVEKSRKSTDVDAFSTIIDAAATVSSDNEEAVKADKFVIKTEATGDDKDKAFLTTTSTGTDVLSDWVSAANVTGKSGTQYYYTLKSKTFKADAGEFTGEIQDSGAVVWTPDTKNTGSLYADMVAASASFAGKFEN